MLQKLRNNSEPQADWAWWQTAVKRIPVKSVTKMALSAILFQEVMAAVANLVTPLASSVGSRHLV
jgi:hypothetical protein